MKTIMIKDTVYRKLASLKKNKSFSDVLDQLVEESRTARMAKIRKHFGTMSDEEAAAIKATIKKIRKEFVVRI